MNPFSIFPWWAKGLALLAAVAALIWAIHAYNESLRDEGRAEVRAEWDADKAIRAATALRISEKNRAIEAERTRLATEAQKRKDDANHAANLRLAADLDRLRNRPERPASGPTPSNPATAPACTGAELFRSDAEFLAREAARADRILAERDYCHDRYDALTVKP